MILEEKRAFKRVRGKFGVGYKLHGAADRQRGTCISKNISLGGVYFVSFEKFEVGQIIDCSIKMPDVPRQGKWTARVVRCEDVEDKMIKTYGVAVEFIEAVGESEKLLKKALNLK